MHLQKQFHNLTECVWFNIYYKIKYKIIIYDYKYNKRVQGAYI